MKAKIIVLSGVSGSGKSTRACELQKLNPNSVIINRDKLREMFFGYSEDNIKEYYKLPDLFSKESLITKYCDKIIKQSLENNKTVIIDNTHVKLKYINEIKKKFGNYEISFELIDTPLEECFKRNSIRTRRVDEIIIKEQFNNLKILKKIFDFKTYYPSYLEESSLHSQQDKSLPRAFIFDIDGTLAKMNGRSPYDYSRVSEDLCKTEIAEILRSLSKDYKIIICSGRKRECLNDTRKWLNSNDISYDEIHIRNDGDDRKDYVVKEEMWKEIIKNYYIVAMIDDRKQVVDHARKLGFTVLQVDEGNF